MNLLHQLQSNPYAAYTYAYPHKTAYRRLEPPILLSEAWAQESKRNLFLYIHIPFCEMRCGFCNLFTTVNAGETLEQAYLDALERQARVVHNQLGEAQFAQMAIGGGTPTYLEPADLHRLFDIAEHIYGVRSVPISVETSPATATPERLQALKERGVTRVSMGIQSFLEAELKALGRPQKNLQVLEALENLKTANFPNLYLDLIYGMENQTAESWLYSLRAVVEHGPQEVFIYPLYVRPLTGLGKLGKSWDDHRLELYRIARDFLTSEGYTQFSMRVFKRTSNLQEGLATLNYDSQQDGMVGLGSGARSYTRGLHYSSEYAVSQPQVKAIVADYVQQPDEHFAYIHYGFRLGWSEVLRRYVLSGLFNLRGIKLNDYHQQHGTSLLNNFPPLLELYEAGLAQIEDGHFRLNARGLELSDAIGFWLYSEEVKTLMQQYELR